MHVIGQTVWQQFFTDVITAGTLHHAYLVVGPAHSGKTTLVLDAVAQLLKITPEKVLTHPDVHWLERLVDEKTSKTKKEISIEQARMVSQFTHESAFYRDGWRVVIIREADRMSRGAANALLKTLEEPGMHTVLFLLADDEAAIMPTIRSRCQLVRLRPVPDRELTAAFSTTTPFMIAAAAGRPGLLAEWLLDTEAWQVVEKNVRTWLAERQEPLAKQWAALEAWCEAAPEDSRAYFYSWIDTGWQALHLAAIGQLSAPSDLLQRLAPALRTAEQALRRNVTPRLALEQVCLAATGHYRV